MSMYGANPEQLTSLGTTLTNQIDAVNGIVEHVNGVLENTLWQGPAKERFAELWHGEFRQTFESVKESLGAAGKDCRSRAEELRRVMGVAG